MRIYTATPSEATLAQSPEPFVTVTGEGTTGFVEHIAVPHANHFAGNYEDDCSLCRSDLYAKLKEKLQ